MKILVATDQWSPDVVGGSARVAADTAHALARRGHEIVVLAPARTGSIPIEHEGGTEVRRVLQRGPFPQTFADPVMTRREARSLRGRSFDLLVAHQSTNAVGLASARLGVPLVLVFHASAVLEMQFLRNRIRGMQRAAAYALHPALVALERRAIARSSGILALSRFSEELLHAHHPLAAGRVHVVGGGVDDAFFTEPLDPEACRRRLGIPPGVLLFTARRLEPRMGVDSLVEAIPLISNRRVVLAVAGDGSLLSPLDRRVHELKLESRVRLLGRVSETDLRSLYAAADLFVIPTVAYEGFGMSTVEALASGTPALGSPVGATPEIVSELGSEFTAPGSDPHALAGAIERVLPLLGPDLSFRSRRLAEEHYRWDTAILRWEKALATVASG